jgi:cleavage stimulation factor subunit 1
MQPKSEVRFRETVYRLMVSQLFYDGYQNVAVALSNLIQVNIFNFGL